MHPRMTFSQDTDVEQLLLCIPLFVGEPAFFGEMNFRATYVLEYIMKKKTLVWGVGGGCVI